MNQIFALKTLHTSFNPTKKIWTDPQHPPLYHPNLSVGHLVVNALSTNPHEINQISHEDGYEMKNWEILQFSVRMALHIKDLGLADGDVVGFSAGNSQYVAPVVFGALLSGTTIGTLSPYLEIDELVHILKITRPRILFCDEQNFNLIRKALEAVQNEVPIYVFNHLDDGDAVQRPLKSVKELLKPHVDELDFV